jgi:hypothetical protein
MQIVPVIKVLVFAGVIMVWLLLEPAQSAGNPYALGYDVIGQAEKLLKQAAVNSPKWHSQQDSIQRDVYDITFLLEQAWRAAEAANDAAMKDYAHHALTVLQRAVSRGYFEPKQIEPVMAMIRQLLPHVSA